MFDKFGEFDSSEELNAAAEGLAAEGDTEGLNTLAEENGIDSMNVEDLMNGDISELTNVLEASWGKLAIEEQETKKRQHMEAVTIMVILDQVKALCAEDDALCAAVRRKGKRVAAIYEAIREEARKNRSGNQPVCVCGTDREMENLIRRYYLHSEEDFKKAVAAQVKRGAA